MTFTLNEKEYDIKPIGFGTIRKLEQKGISVDLLDTMPITVIVGILSITCGLSEDEVCEELDSHISNGGSFDDIMDVITKAFEESGFFQQDKTTKKSTKKTTK